MGTVDLMINNDFGSLFLIDAFIDSSTAVVSNKFDDSIKLVGVAIKTKFESTRASSDSVPM